LLWFIGSRKQKPPHLRRLHEVTGTAGLNRLRFSSSREGEGEGADDRLVLLVRVGRLP